MLPNPVPAKLTGISLDKPAAVFTLIATLEATHQFQINEALDAQNFRKNNP
jgi:hypothetical protein